MSSQQRSCEMQYKEEYPRRPLTRARSKLSHVPLVSESGMAYTQCSFLSKLLCCHEKVLNKSNTHR